MPARDHASTPVRPCLPPPRTQQSATPLTVAQLDRALDDGLVLPHYQPVHELGTGALVAVEALARMRHPGSGVLLPPAAFLPLAERTGRAHLVDDAVAAQALPQAAQWRALLPGRPFSVAVNVSASRLWDRALPSRLAAQCVAGGLPLDALVVELTETARADVDAGHDAVLWELNDLGVNVTLDDFGTGFSTLEHLLRFPVSGVKIDRCFVEAAHLPRGWRVLQALIAVGRALDAHVVAEGVQTTDQLRVLRELGTPFAQGFLFSRPLAPQALTTYLLKHAAG